MTKISNPQKTRIFVRPDGERKIAIYWVCRMSFKFLDALLLFSFANVVSSIVDSAAVFAWPQF